MHMHCEVYLPFLTEDVEEQVAEILDPYNENNDNCKAGLYDWFQLGGRWTGIHTPEKYDPTQDPLNKRKCRWCEGTGFRNDEIGKRQRAGDPAYTCNCCNGTGQETEWPTGWVPYSGDIIAVKDLPDDMGAYYLFVGEDVYESETWNGVTFDKTDFDGMSVKDALAKINITEGFCVTVDCHD
jgi:hypothetical protein